MKTYTIKEMFLTLQGEGERAGTKALFVRFAGCNLWSGRPEDRAKGKGQCSKWCDTDFVGGEKLTARELLMRLDGMWPKTPDIAWRWAVLTGGEPALQLDEDLLDALRLGGWKLAMETNGTVANPVLHRIDHLCVSPKKGSEWWKVCDVGVAPQEVKVVLPGAGPGQEGWTDEELLDIESRFAPSPMYAQPQDPLESQAEVGLTYLSRDRDLNPPELEAQWDANVKRCVGLVLARPRWRVSLQTHKYLGLE